MQSALGAYIKVAVDVRRGLLAGGGEMHADCEAELLADGSYQQDVWGADWDPVDNVITFESFINIRPSQGNRSLRIENPDLRHKVEHIVRGLLENPV
jgi:hypothetical protein